VHGFEWYLSLERWLPLHLFNLQNYRTARHPAICKQLLSVNQGYAYYQYYYSEAGKEEKVGTGTPARQTGQPRRRR
ncbi:hypothetical protein, partial [Thermostichus vulcanus]